MKKRPFLSTLLVFLLFALLSVSGAVHAEMLGVTEEHPLWVEGKGWTNAAELSVGDAVSTLKSGALKVSSIATDAGTHTTYNFEVEDFHTYFVGDSALWVHNMCGGDGGVPKKRRNKAQPHPDAEGPHTTWKKDPQTGKITRHETYNPNPRNPTGFDKVQSTDLKGAPHVNKKTGEAIPTPHTQGKNIPGGVRAATPDEIPR